MIEFKVTRKFKADTYTIGVLNYSLNNGKDWLFICNTLEDTVRATGVKVYGETAIPSGKYKFIMTMSNRFKKIMPLLLNVTGFDGIRIHSGNTSVDTHGCILLGTNNEVGKVTQSTIAYNKLISLISQHPQKDYELEIINKK